MKLFSSWSGGKDCTLALYRILQQDEHELSVLVNMTEESFDKSRSHGQKSDLIRRQAQALGFRLIQHPSSTSSYETEFKNVIRQLKEEGIEGGVFGDIYLQAHRE